jgi:SAM-dependent methyltransferase
MSTLDFIMRQPIVYRLWMAPFAKKKFAPIVARNDMSRVRRVLDVGCGPGTNAIYFSDVDYLGIDLNPQYILDAERRYGDAGGRRRFMAVDAAKFVAPPLVLPEKASVPRFLARSDRGDFPRPLERWRELFSEFFEPICFEPYPLGAFGIPLWNMVYFKGKVRR